MCSLELCVYCLGITSFKYTTQLTKVNFNTIQLSIIYLSTTVHYQGDNILTYKVKAETEEIRACYRARIMVFIHIKSLHRIYDYCVKFYNITFILCRPNTAKWYFDTRINVVATSLIYWKSGTLLMWNFLHHVHLLYIFNYSCLII